MAEQQNLPHCLTLNERKKLALTGVTEVVSFDDTSVVLHTQMGTLVIHGQDLQLKNLSLEGGQITVDGTVSAMLYEESRQTGSWLRRLFG